MAEPVCPRPDELVAFVAGVLPPDRIELLGTHLTDCAACTTALQGVEVASPGLGRLLRTSLRPGPANPFNQDDDYRRMERLAKQAGPSTLSALDAETAGQPRPGADADPPRRLGSYEVHGKIGGGGMGTVYRAFHTSLKKWVALKVLRPERLSQPQAVARFHREMEAVGRLNHDNIVRATDAGRDGDVHFLVMELIEGTDLSQLVHRYGPLPIAEACELIRQAAVALQYAHAAGLVHRDVKPSNLLLSDQGQLKLLDLGLARLVDDPQCSGELTDSDQVMGTPDYTAPEQWESSSAVDIRADLYSLGCTLCTLLVGKPPFSGAGHRSLPRKMAAHLRQPPPDVRLLRPAVPEGVATVLARLLAKEPAERYQTPEEVARALQPFTAGADLATLHHRVPRPETIEVQAPTASTLTRQAEPTVPGQRPPRKLGRRGWAAVGAFVVLLAVGVAVLFAFLPPDRPPEEPPVISAGDAARKAADAFLPGSERDLLDRKPVPLAWPQNPQNSRWDYDEQRKTLWVTCNGRAVLQLAEVRGTGFDLEMTISQTPWVGGVGVFFRGRDEADGATKYFCADLLLLNRFEKEDKQGLTPLTRALLKKLATSRGPYTDLLLAEPIPRPRGGEQRLTISVGRDGLTKIGWGSPAGEVVASARSLYDPLKSVPVRRGAVGSVGVFVQDSSASFRAVRLRIHP